MSMFRMFNLYDPVFGSRLRFFYLNCTGGRQFQLSAFAFAPTAAHETTVAAGGIVFMTRAAHA